MEDLNSQLEAIGEEMGTGNPIVLSVLSTATAFMELSIDWSRTVGGKKWRKQQ